MNIKWAIVYGLFYMHFLINPDIIFNDKKIISLVIIELLCLK